MRINSSLFHAKKRIDDVVNGTIKGKWRGEVIIPLTEVVDYLNSKHNIYYLDYEQDNFAFQYIFEDKYGDYYYFHADINYGYIEFYKGVEQNDK